MWVCVHVQMHWRHKNEIDKFNGLVFLGTIYTWNTHGKIHRFQFRFSQPIHWHLVFQWLFRWFSGCPGVFKWLSYGFSIDFPLGNGLSMEVSWGLGPLGIFFLSWELRRTATSGKIQKRPKIIQDLKEPNSRIPSATRTVHSTPRARVCVFAGMFLTSCMSLCILKTSANMANSWPSTFTSVPNSIYSTKNHDLSWCIII